MASVNISLSEELQQFVDRQVQSGQFAGPSAYIEALIARAKNGNDKLEALLIEGLDSGDPLPLDADQWSQIRSDVQQRLSHGH